MSANSYKKIIDMLAVPHLEARTPGMSSNTGQIDLSRIAIELSKELPDVFMTIHDALSGKHYDAQAATPSPDDYAPVDKWSADIVFHLKANNKVGAIKRRRELTGQGLKEAKDWVDAIQDRYARTGRYEATIGTMPGFEVFLKKTKPTPTANLGELLREKLIYREISIKPPYTDEGQFS